MNRLFHRIVSFVAAIVIGCAGTVQAYAASACAPGGIVFGFFNGIRTTDTSATAALLELERLYGTTLSGTGEVIRYEKFYNYTAGLEDYVETFDQRLREQNSIMEGRYELFLETMGGSGSWWDSIVKTVTGAASVLDGIWQAMQAQFARDLTSLLANPPTSVNYEEHRLRLNNFVLEGKKLVLFAHSQGNLFVNAAADYARGLGSASAVKVVHVAPASPILSGQHVLADKDLVINALRAVGSVPSITSTIPSYIFRPAGVNGRADPWGHGLLEIYVNPSLTISSSVRNLVTAALEEVTAPPQQVSSGFFTVTLTWDGAGDVDLHTFEPGGSHVYYADPVGQVGFLDFDNTTANGPEHYYASCDAEKLQAGNYQVRIANYYGAYGRKATVQIASSKDGVLGTRTVILGDSTADDPVYRMFDVLVRRGVNSGEYSVSLQ